jgi:uncharacterized protein (DUF2235 family)
MKRIALFIDGTWNEPNDNTNVWRLKVLTSDRNGVEQVVHYQKGVGNRFGEWVRGGALGFGLSRNVIEAYRCLVDGYTDGDEVFLFGFSRGAFTARSLAGLIARCGLLRPDALMSADQVYDRYKRGKDAASLPQLAEDLAAGRSISADDQRLLDSSRTIEIKFIGVWDTVGALGVPFGAIRGLSRGTFTFHDTHPSALYKNMYHAVAIDEHRKAFDVTLWTASEQSGTDSFEPLDDDQTLEQRWFVGAHGDVGGNTRLARIPMAWIQDRAAACGLAFDDRVDIPEDALRDAPLDSFGKFAFGFYRIIGLNRRHYRVIGRPPRRDRTGAGRSRAIGEHIDASVFEKWRQDPGFRPKNLTAWAEANDLDPGALTGDRPA